jgi:hypothetical protein
MPWLGDGTWVADARLAKAIVNGKTNYRPWSGDLTTAIASNTEKKDDKDDDKDED